MSDARWRRIEEVFHQATDLSPAERAQFLAAACAGDNDLQREVESLLANDDSADNLVETAVSRAVDRLPGDEFSAGADFVGRHIGPYLVTELIGKGGMGVVLKARDTQLNRTVAIKGLPSGGLAEPERKRRFLHEAKATSALNHPNIVTVHGVTQQDGADFIVMEYVAGKTLDQLIPHKGLPLKQALKYALDIADAVAAAHAAGIVHRDIKPSNVMITEQGRVKVLDFGLAKLAEPGQGASGQGSTETLSTKAGMVFGTAGYMSPEQAEGKPADRRSDIFSFGTLLYQMVTGRRAFPGDHVITILAAVINSEPEPLSTITPDAPRELDWVIRRCLQKDPDRRIQHMVDVKIALEEALELVEAPSGPLTARRPPRRWLAPALIAVLLGLVGSGWLSLRIFRKEPVSFHRLTFRYGDVVSARFAPNGAIVYTAKWEGAQPTTYSGTATNREARDLGLPPGSLQSISSSGDLAILIGASDPYASGTLARVPLAGGVPRPVLENVWLADWGPAGSSLAVVRTENGHHRVEYPIGTVIYETQALRPPVHMRVSPRGDQVAFFDFTANGDYSLIVSDTHGNHRVLSRGWRAVGGAIWSPDGKEIWFGGGRVGGEPGLRAVDLFGHERLLTQIAGWPVVQDVRTDGSLLLLNTDSRIGIRCLAPGDTEERDLAWLDASSVWDMSEDGKAIVFMELSAGEGRNTPIYLRYTDASPAVRLGDGVRPSLSSDGKWVACIRRDRDVARLVLLPTGPGEEKVLSTGAILPETVQWFFDGKRLLITGNEANQAPRTYVLDLTTQRISPVTSPGLRASAISPDGQFAAIINAGKLSLHSLERGRDFPLGEAGPDLAVIRFSGDGRYLFLERPQKNRRSVTLLRVDVRTGHRELWRQLKAPDMAELVYSLPRLSADGKSYAFSFQRDLATLYLVRGIR